MRRPTSHRSFRGGYTLVEVLTVCAIIAILAAMAFPSMVQAIKNARRTKCANNLRQIGIAFASFAHDHGDRYPHQVPISEGGSREQNLESPVLNGQFILSPLAFLASSSAFQSPQVMVCPATKIWVSSFATLNLTNLCYALNLHADPGSATTVLAADSHLLGDWRQLGQTTLDTRQREILFASSRHDNKGNILFGDGHVELRKSVEVPPAQLTAAAQAVSSAKNPLPRGPATPPRLPTESERQSAYQAANPSPATGDVGAQSVAVADPVRGANNSGMTPMDAPARSMPPRVRSGGGAATNPVVLLAPAALELSPTERTLRNSLLWLWLILFLLGAALLAWHFHRQKQRQLERQLRWQAIAVEQEQARLRRSRPQFGRV